MTPRIHVSARDYDTPVYHPVQEREAILPIADEFSGLHKRLTWGVMTLVGLAFWTAVFCWWLS